MTRVFSALVLVLWSVMCFSVGVGVGLSTNRPDVCDTPARYDNHCVSEEYHGN